MDLKDKIINLFSSSNISSPICREAIEIFKTQGFPTKKQEAWKYTSLQSLLKNDFSFDIPKADISENTLKKYIFDENCTHLIFVNGVFIENYSKIIEPSIEIKPISEGVNSQYYHNIAQKDEVFTALNTAFDPFGVYIVIPKGKIIENPIQIIHFITDINSPTWVQPRNLIDLGENAQVKIVEAHYNLSNQFTLTNSVTEITVGKDAILDYYKIEEDSNTASLIDNTYINQQTNSKAFVHTFSLSGMLNRNNLNFYHKGERVESTLKGITILEERQHTDHYTFVHHAYPNCESHQDYKSVLFDNATNVFNGKILVDKIAQKTNAYQQNDNVMLSEKATVYTKPQLEIFADDVKCSHGCTVGEMDSDALFYLQSRGIPKKEAQALLTYAFSHTVMESVRIPSLKKYIEKKIAEKLNVNVDFI